MSRAVAAHPVTTTCTATGPLTPDGLPWPLEDRWRTEDVMGLARGIREDVAFERMPILADALEEAGCDDELVLLHCRECANHVPVCWVVSFCLDGDPLERPEAVIERRERVQQQSAAWEAARASGWESPSSPFVEWFYRAALLAFPFVLILLVVLWLSYMLGWF